MSNTLTASQQIEQLEEQISKLKKEGLAELKAKLADAIKNVATLEKELADLTGQSSSAAPAAIQRRTRRPSITDDDLKPLVLKAMALKGTNGLNAKEIAACVGQDPLRVRKFIAANPSVLKRQGGGPGTLFFLR
jgi:acetyl-CoA carboxylase alpha subunit